MYVHYLKSRKRRICVMDTVSVIMQKDVPMIFGVPRVIKDSKNAIVFICKASDLLYVTDAITKEEEKNIDG